MMYKKCLNFSVVVIYVNPIYNTNLLEMKMA